MTFDFHHTGHEKLFASSCQAAHRTVIRHSVCWKFGLFDQFFLDTLIYAGLPEGSYNKNVFISYVYEEHL